MKDLPARKGWGVAITRDDGTRFLSSSGNGIGRAVWTRAQRRYAVAHKRHLIDHGFKARVVPVIFSEPIIYEL